MVFMRMAILDVFDPEVSQMGTFGGVREFEEKAWMSHYRVRRSHRKAVAVCLGCCFEVAVTQLS